MTSPLSRRTFLAASATAAAAASFPGSARSASAAGAPARTRLLPFSHTDVKLTRGPLKEQFDRTLAYYMALDEDRVLKVYRQAAGQPAPGADMGGWYNPGAFAPGHCFGQWLSALARFSAATKDPAVQAKLERLVDGFAATLDSDRAFYDGHRFKAYVHDKHVIGLAEAYAIARVDRAKDVLRRATDVAMKYLPEKALTREEQAARPHKDVSYTWDESYTNAENLFYAAEVTGDPRYLDLAKRYLHDKPYFDPLAAGRNVLPGLHAYSHVNALSSGAKAYLALGDEKYLKAVTNAWDMIEKTQAYATGGWGPNEAFVEPGKGLLGKSLTSTHNHFETPCGSYAVMKLARYLLRITADPRYGDGLERILYNGILAAKDMGPDGRTFYYSDYSPFARKTYHPDPWPCCAGTYPQAVADYLVSAYFHDDRGLYVNLYVPSELRWNDVTLTQSTDYPEQPATRFGLKLAQAREFALSFRVPAWSSNVTATVNGRPAQLTATPGAFAELRRTWKDGDAVELTLPLTYRTAPVDDRHPDVAALMRGPVVMVAVPDPAASVSPDRVEAANRRQASLESVDSPDPRLVPFYKVRDEPYTTYLTPAKPAGDTAGA